MAPHNYRDARIGVAAMLASVVFLMPQAVLAQQPQTLPTAFAQKVQLRLNNASLDAAIDALARETHISIVADGEPLLLKADFDLDEGLRELLDTVADTFDYTWTVSKDGVVLMVKRFKNPKERPQVNLPEMLEMTRNMIRALNIVDYDKDPTHWPLLVKGVAQTFTAQQLQVLNSGAKLRGSDLLPQQQPLQQAIVANTFLAALSLWEGLLPNLESMPVSRLQARKREGAINGVNTPLYDYLYVFRRSDKQLHVIELPHINYGYNDEQLVTP